MKKYLLLAMLTANVVYAQHMYREASDSCYKNNLWYQVTDLYDASGESSFRCDYCGIYYWSETAKNTHQKTCKYRPHIIFDYDVTGNRTEREIINYHHGLRVISYYESLPFHDNMQRLTLGVNHVAILFKRDESDKENPSRELA